MFQNLVYRPTVYRTGWTSFGKKFEGLKIVAEKYKITLHFIKAIFWKSTNRYPPRCSNLNSTKSTVYPWIGSNYTFNFKDFSLTEQKQNSLATSKNACSPICRYIKYWPMVFSDRMVPSYRAVGTRGQRAWWLDESPSQLPILADHQIYISQVL